MSRNSQQDNHEFEEGDAEPVILTLPSDEAVGLSVQQLCQIIKISPEQARWIIAETRKMAQNGDITGSDDVTKLILAFSDFSQGESSEQDFQAQRGAAYYGGVLTAADIARVFDIKADFAAQIMTAYGRPVNGEADFDDFYNFLREYVQKNYGGKFPETARRVETQSTTEAIAAQPMIARTPEPTMIPSIAQTAPTDTAQAEAVNTGNKTEARPYTDENLRKILNSETLGAFTDKTPEEKEAERKKQIFAKLCEIFAERLEISKEDVQYILEDPENFAVIAGIDDPAEAVRILNDTLNGKIDEALACIERNRNANDEPAPEETHIQAEIAEATQAPAEAPATTTTSAEKAPPPPAAPLITQEGVEKPKQAPPAPRPIAGKGGAPIPNIPTLNEAQLAEAKAERARREEEALLSPAPVNGTEPEVVDQEEFETEKIPMPDNVAESLRLCMTMRGRVTSKSFAEISKNFGSDISASLAKFIIEEGGYGGEGEDKKRIVSEEQLNRIIDDIGADLRGFLRVYLQKVNEQVKNMLYGG